MSSIDLIETSRDEDSDTFSVDSLEVNTNKDSKDFLKASFEKRPISCLKNTESWAWTQTNIVQERCHTSTIPVRNMVDAFSIKADESTVVTRSETYPVTGHACTSKDVSTQPHGVQEGSTSRKIPIRKMVETFFSDDFEDTLVRRSERCSVKGNCCSSERVSALYDNVQETRHTSTIPETKVIEAFCLQQTEEDGMTPRVKYASDDHESLGEWLLIQSNTVDLHEKCQTSNIPARKPVEVLGTQSNTVDLQERCQTSNIPARKTVEVLGTQSNTVDLHERCQTSNIPARKTVEVLGTQSNTVDLHERCQPSNIPARKTVKVFELWGKTKDSQIDTVEKVEKYRMEGLKPASPTLEWVCAQSKTVQENRTTTPERNNDKSFFVHETEDNPINYSQRHPKTVQEKRNTTSTIKNDKSFFLHETEDKPINYSQRYPVTALECTSEWVSTLSSTIDQNREKMRRMEEKPNEVQSTNKKAKKKTKQLEVPFYNRKVSVNEVKKIQKLNNPNPSLKKTSIHVLAGDEYERCSRLDVQSKGVVERWRHNVKPIYEHSTKVELSVGGKDESKRSSMTTISEDVSKMKIAESNLRPRRVSKSLCCERRSASPAVKFNSQAQKPAAQSSKHLPFGYTRRKTSSYLEQYRMEKYGPIYVKRKPPSDGTVCSVFDSSSTVPSLSSELEDKPVSFSSPESSGDELSFYRKIISGELSPRKGGDDEQGRSYRNRLSDEYDNLKSVSQVDVNANRNNSPRRRANYIPYSLEDYRTMLQPTKLGRLGPDLEANKEKFERLRKQREYGDLASLKNIQKMQFQKRKFQAQLKPQPQATADSAQLYSNRYSDNDYNFSTSTSHRHEPFSNATSATVNPVSTLSPETQSNRKTTKTKKKKTVMKTKHKEQEETFKSNRSLIKILQERHKQEAEMTEKLRLENLV